VTLVKSPIGQTVCFVGAPASDSDGVPYTLDGLFAVDEFLPYERSNFVHEAGWIVVDVEDIGKERVTSYFVTADEFEKQVWPKSYGRQIVQEREFQMAAEDGRF
jgi:hypothetical protein